jgi:urease subunit beta
MIPGEYFIKNDRIIINEGRKITSLVVMNTGDRPVQVGSHYHFFEVNSQMAFDRQKSFGMRLNIPAGTAVRFEPGEEKNIELVSIGGEKVVYGLNNLTFGNVTDKNVKDLAIEKAKRLNFKGAEIK